MFSQVTIHDLARWTGGELFFCDNPRKKITSISTDSRTLNSGEVFLAIRGENFDGHRFLSTAVDKGAMLLISEEKIPPSIPQLIVHNTMIAMTDIAKNLREKFEGPVVAITGSAGKSSTKEMVATLLGENTLKSPASFNNLIGVSKTLFLIEDSTEKIVLEMGMNNEKEIKEMCELFRPNCGLITNIGDAHLGKLGGQEGIYRAKKELFDWLSNPQAKTQAVALNADDPLVCRAFKETFGKDFEALTYSSAGAKDAKLRLLKQSLDPKTAFLNVEWEMEGEVATASLPIFGFYHSGNLLAAIAMAKLLGVTPLQIKKRLAAISPAAHRGEIHELTEKRVLVDESYNSNPKALAASLATLAQVFWEGRLVLVIGQMNELGEFSEKKHAEIGEVLLKEFGKNPNLLLLAVGKECGALVETVKSANVPWEVESFASVTDLKQGFSARLKAHDLIYLKGSNSIRLFELIPQLK